MFRIERRRGETAVARQTVRSKRLTDALASARQVGARLGADHMTVSDDQKGFVGVFRSSFRPL